jgi:C4-dicarboxylate-binding protein DctP
LPADLRKGILEAVAKAEARAIPAADGIPAADIQVLREKGMNVTVLTKAQEKTMADAMQPAVIKAFIEASPDGARLIEMLR